MSDFVTFNNNNNNNNKGMKVPLFSLLKGRKEDVATLLVRSRFCHLLLCARWRLFLG